LRRSPVNLYERLKAYVLETEWSGNHHVLALSARKDD
jgi:hypothetical protein